MNKEQLLAWAVKNVTWRDDGSAAIAKGMWAPDKPGPWLHKDPELGEDVLRSSGGVSITRDEWKAARLACGISADEAANNLASHFRSPVTAHSILEAAGGHMRDRAATYDKPEGERSMGATVEAFRAITGHKLTEEQGWLFMQLLKAVRSQQGAYRADSYDDGCAYCALAGEAAARERGGAQ